MKERSRYLIIPFYVSLSNISPLETNKIDKLWNPSATTINIWNKEKETQDIKSKGNKRASQDIKFEEVRNLEIY